MAEKKRKLTKVEFPWVDGGYNAALQLMRSGVQSVRQYLSVLREELELPEEMAQLAYEIDFSLAEAETKFDAFGQALSSLREKAE
jgi:hypothetical protein